MFDNDAIKQQFSRAAPDYDAHAELQQQIREHCIALGEACWEEGAHILDAGSGTGALQEDIAARGINWRVTGIDLALGMCAKAREKNETVVNGDAAAMPFADNCFDGVFSSLMLQWVDSPLIVFREMARVTRPGGRCILATFAQDTLGELREAFASIDD